MNDYILVGLIALIVVFYFYKKSTKSTTTLAMINNGSTVVDVRSPQEFKQGHFEGSVNIPLNSLSAQITKIKTFKTGIIVVCASGVRSAQAKSILNSHGIDCHNGGSWRNLK